MIQFKRIVFALAIFGAVAADSSGFTSSDDDDEQPGAPPPEVAPDPALEAYQAAVETPISDQRRHHSGLGLSQERRC